MGVFTGYYRKARGNRIIVYHGICETAPLRFNTLFINKKRFEQHLRYYKKYCNLVSLDDYYQQRFDPDKFNICISFDDGFAGAYRHALPLLETYQVPAVFFITAIRETGAAILWNDFLSLVYANGPESVVSEDHLFRKQDGKYREQRTGLSLNDHLRTRNFEIKQTLMDDLRAYAAFRNDPSLQDHWLQMREDEISKLSRSPLITIGSHGYYHNDLAYDDSDTLIAELVNSKRFLETITGKPVQALAFPYGSYTQQVVSEAKNAGYLQLLATEFFSQTDNNDPALRERIGINPYISPLSQLHAIIKGNYA
jgi:peptidoglycan/xylan/chitin deacetylase (PgdA/CDA1 family)